MSSALTTMKGIGMVNEFLRPWKLVTFTIGMVWLLYGAVVYRLVDWDIGLSLVMGLYAYFTAGWAVRSLVEGSAAQRALALLSVWFGADGTYWLYLTLTCNPYLESMRSANFPASLALYLLCGMLWAYRGTLSELYQEVRDVR